MWLVLDEKRRKRDEEIWGFCGGVVCASVCVCDRDCCSRVCIYRCMSTSTCDHDNDTDCIIDMGLKYASVSQRKRQTLPSVKLVFFVFASRIISNDVARLQHVNLGSAESG